MSSVDLDAAEQWAALYDETETPNAVKIVRALIAELEELRAMKAENERLREIINEPMPKLGPPLQPTYSDADLDRAGQAAFCEVNGGIAIWEEAGAFTQSVFKRYASAALESVGMKHE